MLKKLGKYELIKKIGQGASSTVYLGRDPFAQRDVAIKVATPEILQDPEKGKLYTHLFLNEASLVGKLNHPHIVQIFDAVVTEKLCYIVMEHVPGGTLEQHARPGQLLPVDQVVELIFKCTRALHFAQRLGITHRDIKPANILINGRSAIKISDFGASITSTRNDRTQIAGIGSPAYMSPQQVMDETLDQRTDIYSLGVVLFQLLTGELPFKADNNWKLVHQIVHATAPTPSSKRAGLPAVLDEIVARATAKSLAERYPTWEAFGQDLADAVRSRQLKIAQPDFAETEKFATLRNMPFFADFSDAEIWEVLSFSTWERLMPGSTVMRDGEPGDFFCFVAAGELDVSKGGKTLNRLSQGDCFGEMAIINPRHGLMRGADVSATTAADIVTVRGEALQQASAACSKHFYQGFMEVLASRLAAANQRMTVV